MCAGHIFVLKRMYRCIITQHAQTPGEVLHDIRYIIYIIFEINLIKEKFLKKHILHGENSSSSFIEHLGIDILDTIKRTGTSFYILTHLVLG